MSGFTSLGDFLTHLEQHRELARVTREVDPEFEITEIAERAMREERPALLFERVKGSDYPLAVNVFGTRRRVELALGADPEKLGRQLLDTVEQLNPPSLSGLGKSRPLWGRLVSARVARRRRAASQQVVLDRPDLTRLPILRCWPGDGIPEFLHLDMWEGLPSRETLGALEPRVPGAGGNFAGRFFTFPLVLTRDPLTGRRNTGLYRMQVHSPTETGMHWQIQKGGGFHYHQAEEMACNLETAVVVGGDPALCLAAAAPLPEGIDELFFAGFLRGSSTKMTRAKTLEMLVPAGAEFVLEGVVPAGQRRLEGPFGDHFGHYSKEAPFPVFRVNCITSRRRPVFHASVVGKPPKEDRCIGDALQLVLSPLLKLIHPEVRSVWAYYEAGFHNLLVVSVAERYGREAVKTALSLMGEGQLSLTKVVILVSGDVDPRDFPAVLRQIRANFDPGGDFILLPGVPLDTLDFTGPKMNLGSKVVIDATPRPDEPQAPRPSLSPDVVQGLAAGVPGISDAFLWEESLLAVTVRGDGRQVLARLLEHPALTGVAMIAAVSEDVNIRSLETLLWGIFTRFDGARDLLFAGREWQGIAPRYSGPMAIDATWKPGYPPALEMHPDVVRTVDQNWNRYWENFQG